MGGNRLAHPWLPRHRVEEGFGALHSFTPARTRGDRSCPVSRRRHSVRGYRPGSLAGRRRRHDRVACQAARSGHRRRLRPPNRMVQRLRGNDRLGARGVTQCLIRPRPGLLGARCSGPGENDSYQLGPGISNIDLVQAAGQYNCQELLDTKEKAMRKVIYSMNVSLDGFVEGPNRELDWSTPDEELHRFWNDHARQIGTSLYGRRLYELMAEYWPTADADPSAPDYVVEFARIWRDTAR